MGLCVLAHNISPDCLQEAFLRQVVEEEVAKKRTTNATGKATGYAEPAMQRFVAVYPHHAGRPAAFVRKYMPVAQPAGAHQ